jgi:hypothetical protein
MVSPSALLMRNGPVAASVQRRGSVNFAARQTI